MVNEGAASLKSAIATALRLSEEVFPAICIKASLMFVIATFSGDISLTLQVASPFNEKALSIYNAPFDGSLTTLKSAGIVVLNGMKPQQFPIRTKMPLSSAKSSVDSAGEPTPEAISSSSYPTMSGSYHIDERRPVLPRHSTR